MNSGTPNRLARWWARTAAALLDQCGSRQPAADESGPATDSTLRLDAGARAGPQADSTGSTAMTSGGFAPTGPEPGAMAKRVPRAPGTRAARGAGACRGADARPGCSSTSSRPMCESRPPGSTGGSPRCSRALVAPQIATRGVRSMPDSWERRSHHSRLPQVVDELVPAEAAEPVARQSGAASAGTHSRLPGRLATWPGRVSPRSASFRSGRRTRRGARSGRSSAPAVLGLGPGVGARHWRPRRPRRGPRR